ncbi:hypothetical protein TorRG33x02_218160, partial [Trema orientale]
FVMSFHKVILSIISILATFIQVEFQSSSSLFDEHFWIISTFFVVFSIYVVSWITVTMQKRPPNTENDNDDRVSILSQVNLLVGALAAILLLFIILPLLGWLAFFFWLLYSLKTVCDLVNFDAFFQLLQILKNAFSQFYEKLKNAFLQLLEKLKNAVYGDQSQEPEIPGSM